MGVLSAGIISQNLNTELFFNFIPSSLRVWNYMIANAEILCIKHFQQRILLRFHYIFFFTVVQMDRARNRQWWRPECPDQGFIAWRWLVIKFPTVSSAKSEGKVKPVSRKSWNLKWAVFYHLFHFFLCYIYSNLDLHLIQKIVSGWRNVLLVCRADGDPRGGRWCVRPAR